MFFSLSTKIYFLSLKAILYNRICFIDKVTRLNPYRIDCILQVKSNVSPKAASTRLKRKNIKNLLFELKSNTSSLLSKIFSLFVKLDIEVNESSLLNWIFCLLLQIFISLIGVLASRSDYGLFWVEKSGIYLSLLLFWYFLLLLFFFIFIYAVLP